MELPGAPHAVFSGAFGEEPIERVWSEMLAFLQHHLEA